MPDPIAVHRELLESWRKVMDLVGPGPVEEHFVDAEGAVAGLNAKGAWVDLGSGAGFPGIMLAARWPESQVTLVERRQKRVAFLEEVLARSGLQNARVFAGDVATLERGIWRGVISRAYKPPPAFLADALELLGEGGMAVALTADEVPAPPPGLSVFHVERYSVEKKPRASIRYLRRQ
ncbi:hypothetical protein LBMAG42_16950 [Deltaproteobacteria bacterium]|nr:hypothetical protein LBMAG42_16950 [Deltaproteobacteria bacterium]